MTRLWLKTFKDHRINAQSVSECVWGQQSEVLVEMCKQLDLPCPIWLKKHEGEFDRFRRTSFLPEHFVESVDFDKMEIEFLDDSDKKRKSSDPRNQF